MPSNGPILPFIDQDTFAGGARAGINGWSPASNGSNWNVIVNGSATIAVASNEGTLTNSAASNVLYLGSSTGLNTEGLMRFSTTNVADEIRMVVRGNSAGNTFYFARAASGNISIRKLVSGTFTTLVTQSLSENPSTFYWFRFRVLVNLLYLKYWNDSGSEPAAWTMYAQDSDVNLQGVSGRFGVHIIPTVSTHTVSLDNVTFSTVPLPPVAPTATRWGKYRHSIGRVQ